MRLALLGAVTFSLSLVAGHAQAAPTVTGDYVEARSANVFIGACHREGEIQTGGREAVLAWNVADGEFNGVSLRGVAAVALVSADKNLDLDGAKRRSVLYISDAATPAQREAFAALISARASKAVGELVGVKTAPVSFDAKGDLYRVHVPGAASMKIQKQSGQSCCKQPYQRWGAPFVPVKTANVGFSLSTEFKDASLLRSWSVTDQNNAYFGQFSL